MRLQGLRTSGSIGVNGTFSYSTFQPKIRSDRDGKSFRIRSRQLKVRLPLPVTLPPSMIMQSRHFTVVQLFLLMANNGSQLCRRVCTSCLSNPFTTVHPHKQVLMFGNRDDGLLFSLFTFCMSIEWWGWVRGQDNLNHLTEN